jgi:hypothetical protein
MCDQACKTFHLEGTTTKLAHVVGGAVLRGWQEFDRLRDRAMRTGLQDAAERAAFDYVRKTRAVDSCIVCQDRHPDMLTTCCAAPYHLKCLTKWLVSGHNASCCKCRAEISFVLPRLPELGDGRARAGRRGVRGGSGMGGAGPAHGSGGLDFDHGAAEFGAYVHDDAPMPQDAVRARERFGLHAFAGSGPGSELEEEDLAARGGQPAVAPQIVNPLSAQAVPLAHLVRSEESDEETTTTACEGLRFSSSSEGDEEVLVAEADEGFAWCEPGMFGWRAGGSPPQSAAALLALARSLASSRRQGKCPRCNENQQASDCDFGACGQCCRTLRREAGRQPLRSAPVVCRRHPL